MDLKTELTVAELRRQRILKNCEKRLDLLIGVKNSDRNSENEFVPKFVDADPMSTFKSENANNISNIVSQNASIDKKISSTRETVSNISKTTIDQHNLFRAPKVNVPENFEKTKCSFNGYSNQEIFLLFSISLCSCIFFMFEISNYIYQVKFFSA